VDVQRISHAALHRAVSNSIRSLWQPLALLRIVQIRLWGGWRRRLILEV
jgi:hypothetical protein